MRDQIKNPIPKSGLFATQQLEDIQQYIENLSGTERAAASLVFMLTLNACNQMVEDEILSANAIEG